MDYLLFWTELS